MTTPTTAPATFLVVERVNAVLNPHLHLWGWETAIYLFLAGIAAGLLIFASWVHLAGLRRAFLPAVQVASLLVPPLIVASLVLVWLHLGSKWTPFWQYVTLRPTSSIWWGSWILLVALLTSFLAAVPAFLATNLGSRLRQRWRSYGMLLERVGQWVDRHDRALAWANLTLGTGLGLYTGIAVSTIVAWPAWNSPILGPLFLASGLSGAAAVLLLMAPSGLWTASLIRAEATLHTVNLGLMGLYLLGLATSGAAAQAAAAALVRGEWASAFWVLVVGTGMAIPLAVRLREILVHHCPRPLAIASCALNLTGGLALRVVLVFAGQRGL